MPHFQTLTNPAIANTNHSLGSTAQVLGLLKVLGICKTPHIRLPQAEPLRKPQHLQNPMKQTNQNRHRIMEKETTLLSNTPIMVNQYDTEIQQGKA